MLHLRSLGALVASFTLVFAACGDDDGDETGADTTERTTTTAEPTTESTEETTTTSQTEDTTAVMVTVQTAETSLGTVLVDGDGKTLYAFTMDTAGAPTCAGGCAGIWPPLLVDAEPVIGPGVDASVITTVPGAEGGTQVKAGQWPLYRFSSDAAPGEVNGQGVGGIWFAVHADGTLVEQPT